MVKSAAMALETVYCIKHIVFSKPYMIGYPHRLLTPYLGKAPGYPPEYMSY